MLWPKVTGMSAMVEAVPEVSVTEPAEVPVTAPVVVSAVPVTVPEVAPEVSWLVPEAPTRRAMP